MPASGKSRRRAVATLWAILLVGVAGFALLEARTGIDVDLLGPGLLGAVVVAAGATVAVLRGDAD